MSPKASSASPGLSERERARGFTAVIRWYRESHRASGNGEVGPYRMTKLGAWAASRGPHVFSFFSQIHLTQYPLFLDLGSGDGLVCCIAALFTRTVGIEVDYGLCEAAAFAARELGLGERATFICGDYLQLPIHRADCLYHYPDKPMFHLEELLVGWQGDLIVYGPHFPLRTMVPTRTFKCGRESIVVYHSAKSL